MPSNHNIHLLVATRLSGREELEEDDPYVRGETIDGPAGRGDQFNIFSAQCEQL